MKKCPFCAEEIQEEAIKCRFCNEMLFPIPEKKDAGPWYFSVTTLVLGFLVVGPFILPLLWVNPKISLWNKVIGSVIITIISIVLVISLQGAFISIKKHLDLMQGI